MHRSVTFRVLGAAMAALVPATARADASPHFDFSGFYFPFGANVGAALRGQGNSGLLLGGEVSSVYYWANHELSFLGGYVDYLRDFGEGVHRISLGPELGAYFCGIDGGPVLDFGKDEPHLGGRVRIFGSLALVTLYVGEWYRPSVDEGNWSTEVGLLLKIPTLNYEEGEGWTFDPD